MLYYNRIDISEGIDLRSVAIAKNEMICHYCFFNHGFEFQYSVCNGCHDLTMLSVIISDIAIITVKNVNYRCIIHNITKSEAISLLKKSVQEDRGYLYKNIASFLFFVLLFLFSIYKMVDNICMYKSPYLLRYVLDQYKTQQMCD